MPTFTDANSVCVVYIYREGLLSTLGHDLKLTVTHFTIDVVDHPLAIRGKFHADSLRVLGTMHNGEVREDELSAQETQQIESSIARDVLAAHRYPLITFHSTSVVKEDGTYHVTGWLELHGTKKELRFVIAPQPEQLVATITVHQPDYGIAPYRAFFGALKVKPAVRVEIAVPITVGAETSNVTAIKI